MVALMTLWFGPFVEIEPGHGYFHLCPRCFEEFVTPHLEDVQETLARLHPAAAAYLERERAAEAGRAEAEAEAADAEAAEAEAVEAEAEAEAEPEAETEAEGADAETDAETDAEVRGRE